MPETRRGILRAFGAGVGLAAAAGRVGRAAAADKPKVKQSVRVAAVSWAPPFHDHRKQGVDLRPLREMVAKVVKESRPDFLCFPEGCTCVAGGFEKGVEIAPDLDAHAAEVGKIAREFDVALIAPFLERSGNKVYNSVPVVDRSGRLAMVYRKNYPTMYELERGVSPGTEIPVAECDGVRVGASVCFDLNFDFVAAALEKGRARLVFWPSMYWGGAILQHWALRYGFAMVAVYGLESAIVDMSGRYLAKQGADTFQVRRSHLPPWATADIVVNRELFHLDDNQDKFVAIREKHGPDVEIEVFEPEGFFLLASRRADLPVEEIAVDFKLETLRDFLARSVAMRDAFVAKDAAK